MRTYDPVAIAGELSSFEFVDELAAFNEILTVDDRHRLTLSAGQFTIVPKGRWHRHVDARDVVELFHTPGATVNSDADDPRGAEAAPLERSR
ncbi:hypothetical protein ACQEVB_28660 [Pseudonocardia sp. CA-107938]|uniref:hypothetical protein n=1 Tax=Pseudonocardia sp. CA-107938 TaxID=3240021 RepID=UPI003D9078EA